MMIFLFIGFLIYLSVIDYKTKEIYDYQLLIAGVLAYFCGNSVLEYRAFADYFITFSVAFMILYLLEALYINVLYFIEVEIKKIAEEDFNSFAFGDADKLLIAILATLYSGEVFDLAGFSSLIYTILGVWIVYCIIKLALRKERRESAFIPFITFGFVVQTLFNY